MRIEMATVDPELATEYIRSLPDQGYACTAAATAADPGQMCQLDTTDPKYNVAIGDTVFLRDATYIHVAQANVSTPDLLASLEAKIWD